MRLFTDVFSKSEEMMKHFTLGLGVIKLWPTAMLWYYNFVFVKIFLRGLFAIGQ